MCASGLFCLRLKGCLLLGEFGFAAEFPQRFFDVGIAEEHAVTFACGLASKGMRPVFAVYSTFLQRSYDQIIHDAAMSGLHIVLAIDRAGIVGDDGETHQGVFDVSMLNISGIIFLMAFSFKLLLAFFVSSFILF